MEKEKVMRNLECSYQKEANILRNECVDALKNENWAHVEPMISEYKRRLELEQNRLNVFVKDEMKEAYYLGQIAALVIIFQQLKDEKEAEAEAELIRKNSPLLEKCIAYIGDNQMVTCGQIIRDLNLKRRSDFSNALNRQKKYGFIAIYKMGNKNLYSLSGKGKKYYYTNLYSAERSQSIGKEITTVINTLSENIKNGEINPVLIAMKMARTNQDLRAYYISEEFNAALTNYKKNYIDSVSIKNKLKESFGNLSNLRNNKGILPDDSYEDGQKKEASILDAAYSIR